MRIRTRKHYQHVELIRVGEPGTPSFTLGITYPQNADRRIQAHRAWGYPESSQRKSANFPDKIKIPLPTRVQTSLYHRLPPEAKALINNSGSEPALPRRQVTSRLREPYILK